MIDAPNSSGDYPVQMVLLGKLLQNGRAAVLEDAGSLRWYYEKDRSEAVLS